MFDDDRLARLVSLELLRTQLLGPSNGIQFYLRRAADRRYI